MNVVAVDDDIVKSDGFVFVSENRTSAHNCFKAKLVKLENLTLKTKMTDIAHWIVCLIILFLRQKH